MPTADQMLFQIVRFQISDFVAHDKLASLIQLAGFRKEA